MFLQIIKEDTPQILVCLTQSFQWDDSPQNWLSVQYSDIYSYLINNIVWVHIYIDVAVCI